MTMGPGCSGREEAEPGHSRRMQNAAAAWQRPSLQLSNRDMQHPQLPSAHLVLADDRSPLKRLWLVLLQPQRLHGRNLGQGTD